MQILFIAVFIYIIHWKLNYDWKITSIISVIGGIISPLIILAIINNMTASIIICLIAFGAYYLLTYFNRQTALKEWNNKTIIPMTSFTFSNIINSNIDNSTMAYTHEIPANRARFFCYNLEDVDTEANFPIVYNAEPSANENSFQEYGFLISAKSIIIRKKNTDKDSKKLTEDIIIPFQGIFLVKQTNSGFNVFYENSNTKKIKLQPEDSNYLIQVINNAVNSGWTHQAEKQTAMNQNEINNDVDQAVLKAEQNIKNNYNNHLSNVGATIGVSKSIDNALNNNQINDRFGGGQGHGHVGEQYGDAFDKLKFKQTKTLGATHEKGGADRVVNGKNVQTKYAKTAGKSIGQAFIGGQAKYINPDGSMMQIEVPRDQYPDAVNKMAQRIKNGEVPNEMNPENASNYVKKGAIDYDHSQIATKSIFDRNSTITHSDGNGNIITEKVSLGQKLIWSAGGDFVTGAANALPVGITTSVWVYCNNRWQGNEPGDALKAATIAGAKPIISAGVIYTAASQFSGSKVGKRIATQLFNESTPKLTNATINVATIAIVVGPDLIDCLNGRISVKQLTKNAVVSGTGIAVGAAAGSVVPGVGTVIGGAVGGMAAKKIADNFVEDDSIEMIKIAKEEFINTTLMNPLSKEELNDVLEKTFLDKKFPSQLKTMFAADDPRKYIHDRFLNFVVDEFKQRDIPDENEFTTLLNESA